MPAYEFNLPVDPGGMPPVIHLAQYDTGRTYHAKLKQGGDYYYTGLGVTAKIKGRNARGVCWELPCTIDTSLTYKVSFTPEGAATDQFGIMPVQMELTDSQGVISTLLMVWDIQRAGYTSEEAATSPEFETALEEAVAAAIAQQGLGFTEEFKQALLACLNNVAWATPDGQSLVDDLEDALYPEVHLTSITADFDQDHPIYSNDSLETVIATINLDLTVVANYSDGTSETLSSSAYTISGTVEVGASVPFTVSYEGKTDTINVLILQQQINTGYIEIGSPTISDNILTVANGKFIKSNVALSPSTSSWKVVCKYKTNRLSSNYGDVFGSVDSSGTSVRGILFELNNANGTNGGMFLSSNTEAWDISNVTGDIGYTTGNWIWIAFEFDGTTYTMKKSNDGTNWTNISTKSSSTPIIGGYAVGFGLYRSGVINGQIDLSECKIYVDGNLYWSAV